MRPETFPSSRAVQCTPDLDGMEVDQENLKPAAKKVF